MNKNARFSAAILLGGAAFALSNSSILWLLCYAAVFPSCTGSLFHPFVFLIFGVAGVVLTLVSYGIHTAIQKVSWYRAWHMLPIFVCVSVLGLRIYSALTAPEAQISEPLSTIDYVFGLSGLVAGVVVLVFNYSRSNYVFNRTR